MADVNGPWLWSFVINAVIIALMVAVPVYLLILLGRLVNRQRDTVATAQEQLRLQRETLAAVQQLVAEQQETNRLLGREGRLNP
jgi:uncharacterized membrane protein (DUF106 family)